ncbi:DMT family transporter [Oceanibacterium hippocampi]|uniref:EamA-like transporter family protein n=1 Tax=Oceanibacterium hippocampi TaxID=745714 RepID=A0A1Y5TEM1_9PROT|nr:DMT family transporter [Oceanibacterium hippocampi]SLN60207.1 EamA-like transporter family protein [Oceanibacterium hippocampi]
MLKAAAPAPGSRDNETGMLMMVTAMLMVPGIDAFAKVLTQTMPSGEIAAARFVFQSVLLAPLMLFRPRRTAGLGLLPNALRGGLLAAATLLFFSALAYMPLAETVAIFFVEPLILTLLSVPLLGEKIGWRRIVAISVGLAGAMIVIRPSAALFGLAAFLPLGAATCFAFYLILTRRLAPSGDAVTMQFLAGVFGALIMAVALVIGSFAGIAVLDPVMPDGREFLMLAGLGVIATIGHQLVVLALRRASAGLLAPFQYLEIVSATILGYLVFAEFPGPTTWLGIVLIVLSGVYVFHRERRLKG